jgi:hypothetical protein
VVTLEDTNDGNTYITRGVLGHVLSADNPLTIVLPSQTEV